MFTINLTRSPTSMRSWESHNIIMEFCQLLQLTVISILVRSHIGSISCLELLRQSLYKETPRNVSTAMERYADSPCDLCFKRFPWNSPDWTWVRHETNWEYKFCCACVHEAELTLRKVDQNANEDMRRRMVFSRLLEKVNSPCSICCKQFLWNSPDWTWVRHETKWGYKFCPTCVHEAELTLGVFRLLGMVKSEIADTPQAGCEATRNL